MAQTKHEYASSSKRKEAEDQLARTIASIVGVPIHIARRSRLFLDRIEKYQKLSLGYRLKRLIPGTHDFKRNRQRTFITETSMRAILFAGLKSLTDDQKNSILRKFVK